MDKHFFGLTDQGKSRENNEDTFIVKSLDNDQLILGAVIDGVGGYSGGEVAAAIASEAISNHFTSRPADPIAQMILAFRDTNKAIVRRKQGENQLAEMACVATVVLADIENNQFYYAHVGDTRLYLLRDGSLVKISNDHSFVGFLEDSGRLDEASAMQHPKRNEINKAIGFSEQIETDESYIETGQSPFLPGDVLLICSDGLTDMVNKQDMVTLLAQGDTLSKKAGNLIALANENGGRDNITVVLLQNNKTTRQPETVQTNLPLSATEPIKIRKEQSHEHTFDEPSVVSLPPKKKYWIIALVLLCLILLVMNVLLYLQTKHNPSHSPAPIPFKKKEVRNAQERLLQDAFDNAVGDTIILSDSIFKSPVIVSGSLQLRRDTLYVFGRGIVLQADTGYKGVAMTMLPQSKILMLDSLHFKGFDNAIAISNQSLLLKNVIFTNCKLPVKNSFNFPDQQPISASFPQLSPLKSVNLKAKDPRDGAK